MTFDTGEWEKYEYNNIGREIYRDKSTGYFERTIFDGNGRVIYRFNNTGYWEKSKLVNGVPDGTFTTGYHINNDE